LTRILERIHSKDTAIFTQDEQLKLQSVLGINESVVMKGLIETLCVLWEQIVYHLLKPKVIVSQLVGLGVSQEKALLCAQIWATHGSLVCERFRDRSYLIANQQLVDVNCKLLLQTSHSSSGHLKTVLTQVDLVLAHDDTKQHKNNISIEFDHEQLSQFYNQLESIQTQIDQLQK